MEFKNILDRRQLASFLDIEYRQLTNILYAKKIENLYVSFDIPKKNGEVRHINAPTASLKFIQRKLADRLYDAQERYYTKGKRQGVAQGFIKKRSIITNAENHRHKKIILNVDLQDFFDSFHFGRVKGYFEKNINFRLPPEVSLCVAQLACYQGKLPQGSPCSPVIANLICSIMDNRILGLTKQYKLVYTRYADDLTFSTNDPHFPELKDQFLQELALIVNKSGFCINESKTRFSFYTARQEVTGLVVNNRISIKREYYKSTRSMVDHIYRGLGAEIDGEPLSINAVEGRLAYINQVDKYDNIHREQKDKKRNYIKLNGREKEYRNFLFYKYFYAQHKPLLVTEGKTDIIYLKSALRNLYQRYPKLIRKKKDGSFEYLISFFQRSSRFEYLFNISIDGADTLANIYNYYVGNNNCPNLFLLFGQKTKQKPSQPVILIFDNEQISERPLKKFLQRIKKPKLLKEKNAGFVTGNLFVVTNSLVEDKKESEIEDLFTEDLLKIEINGKTFDRKGKDSQNSFGKAIFANYIASHYMTIDFSAFIPFLDTINKIIEEYPKCEI